MKFFACLALAVLLTTGCRSVQELGSNRNAAVMITNRTAEAIETATRKVFEAHGFEPAKAEADELVFQRPGTFMKSLWYGDVYSGGVWVRVKVYQKELEGQRTLLDADVYMVQEHDDPLFEKPRRVNGHNGECQKLLDETAAGLRKPEPKPEQGGSGGWAPRYFPIAAIPGTPSR
jgi:hypothetical protein